MAAPLKGRFGAGYEPRQGRARPLLWQMRTVGQCRRDAEEKPEHHLEEARHKIDPLNDYPDNQEDVGAVEAGTLLPSKMMVVSSLTMRT